MTELTVDMQPAFIPNAGQADQEVYYYVQGTGHGISFMEDGVVFAFLEPSGNEQQSVKGYAVALRFLGANSGVKPEGRQEASGKVNYLYGSDPSKWQADLPTYEEIVYPELWPHIDMVFRRGNGRVKYEFVVQPGARIEDIRLTYGGADSLLLDESGNLIITTPTGTLMDERPIAIQEKDGQQVEVESAFLIQQGEDGQQSFGFVLGEGYDPQVPLVIDPGLVFSTLLGSGFPNGVPNPVHVAVDSEGGIYVTGYLRFAIVPTTEGAFDRTRNGNDDVFVTKLNAIGSALVYSTYIGGRFDDNAEGIAVDSEGNAYVTGITNSDDFPTTEGAYDRTLNPGFSYDGFILKLNSQGNSLIYSTLLGGTSDDFIQDIKIDAEGNAYVAGRTGSPDFPTTDGAYDRAVREANYFVTKLNTAGSGLVFSTYLGEEGINDARVSIALDAGRNAYVTSTAPDSEGFVGIFVKKLNAMGSGLVYSTGFGGSLANVPESITVDFAGNAYVTGRTNSADFPTTEGAYDTTFNGSGSAFVTKLNAEGTDFVYSTYLGGSDGSTEAYGIAVDPEGNAYVTGATSSANFPITDDAFQKTLQGNTAFITKLNKMGSALLYSSFIGGIFGRGGITIDSANQIYVVGSTESLDFPTTEGAFDRTFLFDQFFQHDYKFFITKWNMTTQTTGVDLSVAVADLSDPAPIGTPLTYIIQVRNNGPQTATGIRLIDLLPQSVSFLSVSSTRGECSVSGQVVTCEVGTLLSGETVTVSITVLPTRFIQLQSAIFVVGNEGDPNPANNTVVITTTVIAKPPRQEILDLIGMVNSLVFVGVLTQVQASFLNNKLWAAVSQLDAENVEGACSELCAFCQKVISYKHNGILDQLTANQLLRTAAAIRRQLGCE